MVEYAKAEAEDILIRISASNRGPDPAPLHLLPTLWFRNAWSWGYEDCALSCAPWTRRRVRQGLTERRG